MGAIFEREFKSYFKSITGYVFVAFVLLFAGIYTVAVNLFGGVANFEYVFGNMSIVYLLGIPVLSMRCFAEERGSKTDQLLYALPMGMTKIVLGKYLAMLAVLALPLLVLCIYPLILSLFGSVYFLTAYSSIFAYFLLGAALISGGMFFSSLTENQIIAAVMTLVAVLLNYYGAALASLLPATAFASFMAFSIIILIVGLVIGFITKNVIFGSGAFLVLEGILTGLYLWKQAAFESLFLTVMQETCLFNRLYTFINGTFDITAVVLYLAVIVVFVYLTVQSLEKRRWS